MKNTMRAFHGEIVKNYGTPTDAQLAKINSRLETPLTKEDVFVFRAVASNRNRDSYYSIMADTSLQNYATDYSEGRSFMNNHRTGERATGRTFDAEFNATSGEVVVWTYTVRGLKLNEVSTDDFIRGVESGLIQDVSIHFSGGTDTCNVCSKRLYSKGCRHLPGMEYEDEVTGTIRVADYTIGDAHAVELSDAWKGSTPEAGILRKAALMQRSGLLDDKTVRLFNSRFQTNLRTTLEGEEFLNFDWEDSDASDDDGNVGADGNPGSDGDGAGDPNPVTGLKKNNPVSDAHVSTDSNLDGRNSNEGKMTKEEIAANKRKFTELLEKRAAELDPEYVADIKTYLRELDEGKDPMPPVDKSKTKKDGEDDDDKKGRFLKPKDAATTVVSCIRAMGDKMMPASFSSGEMEPGKGGMAGMIMKGQEPLQNVSSEAFHEIDGEATPSEADLVAGLTSMDSPLLTINPSGMISFFFKGQSTAMGDAGGVGDGGAVYVAERDAEGAETRTYFEPIVSKLDDPETVRALVTMAVEGQRHTTILRAAMLHDLVRYGCIVQGNKFDREFHVDLAKDMSTERLYRFVQDWKQRATDHLKTNPQQQMAVSEFLETSVTARQTVVKGQRGDESRTVGEEIFNRNELFA